MHCSGGLQRNFDYLELFSMRLNLSTLVFFAFHPKFSGCEPVNTQENAGRV